MGKRGSLPLFKIALQSGIDKQKFLGLSQNLIKISTRNELTTYFNESKEARLHENRSHPARSPPIRR